MIQLEQFVLDITTRKPFSKSLELLQERIDAVLQKLHVIQERLLQKSSKSSIIKQPSRGVLRKRCSVNMQQLCRRTPMPKCDFNKVAEQLY